MSFFVWLITLWLCTCSVLAQPESEPDAGLSPPVPALRQGDLSAPEARAVGEEDAGAIEADAQVEVEPAPSAPVDAPPAEPRGDKPISAEEIMGEAPSASEQPAVSEQPDAGQAAPPPKEEPTKPPHKHVDAAVPAPEPPPPPPPGPLVVWATAEWGNALGRAHCAREGLTGTEAALRVASTLEGSTAVGGLGVATGGALSDHPLLAYAGHERPEQLARLLSSAGFSALGLGVSDLAGPLFREPRLSEALEREGVSVVATNLRCGGQAYCASWHTAEDPLPILERRGRRYALLAVLPDDVLGRVQPVLGEALALEPAQEAMVRRLNEARDAGADLVVAIMDHGPDATAGAALASFVAELPPDTRPDLMLSPSAGENLLFLRPLDVQPAIIGTRRGVLTGVRVTRLEDRDADVLARSVRPGNASTNLAGELSALGRDFCAARASALPGGQLSAAMSAEDFVGFAGAAALQKAHADLALVDPRAFEPSVAFAAGDSLQRAELARAVPFDSPLVVAKVTLDWLNGLRKDLNGMRPLTLVGIEQDGSDTLIAGRLAVPGARYRIVTSAVLARSQRLPSGAQWRPLTWAGDSLRGALTALLDGPGASDPRARLHDPLYGTQWLIRMDGQVLANLTAVSASPQYDDAALRADDSRQVGGRLVFNADADAPKYLFENTVQVAFDRNFVTRTTAQDLSFAQTTYTYRGLWPKSLFYPHPFAEGYLEWSFLQPEEAEYHHMLLRPRAGIRSMFTRVFSLKLAAGLQYEVFDKGRPPYPGLGGELLLKPWTIVGKSGTLQLEGNVVYYWDSPGNRDEHLLRGQLIAGYQLIGPLQITLSTLGVLRKLPDVRRGQGISMQLGIRVRFVSRALFD